ncbi:TPA: FAD-binding protein [Candidatus Berkelbacteria bacterium]|uniref:Glutaredoxin n=1 Tax=Berkelbacteria bacterium GW2011_GWE1_39_12 TaxID=1618337 RepID=A0A0G4B2B5_9BACT|nr:MAG: glutaredoxin [Berkelbacteria bacterium GW2011_GWE1_39_12]HBO60680.1 FAD-binding protein [Candidatus Berkelbacteria bacterium]
MIDVIIIGAGAAGYSAAIYLARKKMNILILSNDLGGQIAKSGNIENYLGFESISGAELCDKFQTQVKNLGVEIKMGEVKEVRKIENGFEIVQNEETFQAKSLILASGKTPRKLGVPGEEEFAGKGVGYCATCDGPLFHDKTVVVLGGGNSALDAALEMEKYAKKVYILNLNEDLQGDEILKDRFDQSEKSELINNAKTTEILGDKFVKSLKYQDTKTSEVKEIACDGVFIEIGWQPATDMVKDLVKLNEIKEIEVDQNMATLVEGIYAAGDVTNGLYKQCIIASGQGATAALSAWKYIITHR